MKVTKPLQLVKAWMIIMTALSLSLIGCTKDSGSSKDIERKTLTPVSDADKAALMDEADLSGLEIIQEQDNSLRMFGSLQDVAVLALYGGDTPKLSPNTNARELAGQSNLLFDILEKKLNRPLNCRLRGNFTLKTSSSGIDNSAHAKQTVLASFDDCLLTKSLLVEGDIELSVRFNTELSAFEINANSNRALIYFDKSLYVMSFDYLFTYDDTDEENTLLTQDIRVWESGKDQVNWKMTLISSKGEESDIHNMSDEWIITCEGCEEPVNLHVKGNVGDEMKRIQAGDKFEAQVVNTSSYLLTLPEGTHGIYTLKLDNFSTATGSAVKAWALIESELEGNRKRCSQSLNSEGKPNIVCSVPMYSGAHAITVYTDNHMTNGNVLNFDFSLSEGAAKGVALAEAVTYEGEKTNIAIGQLHTIIREKHATNSNRQRNTVEGEVSEIRMDDTWNLHFSFNTYVAGEYTIVAGTYHDYDTNTNAFANGNFEDISSTVPSGTSLTINQDENLTCTSVPREDGNHELRCNVFLPAGYNSGVFDIVNSTSHQEFYVFINDSYRDDIPPVVADNSLTYDTEYVRWEAALDEDGVSYSIRCEDDFGNRNYILGLSTTEVSWDNVSDSCESSGTLRVSARDPFLNYSYYEERRYNTESNELEIIGPHITNHNVTVSSHSTTITLTFDAATGNNLRYYGILSEEPAYVDSLSSSMTTLADLLLSPGTGVTAGDAQVYQVENSNMNSEGQISIVASGLAPQTEYHFNIIAADEDDNVASYGAGSMSTTLGVSAHYTFNGSISDNGVLERDGSTTGSVAYIDGRVPGNKALSIVRGSDASVTLPDLALKAPNGSLLQDFGVIMWVKLLGDGNPHTLFSVSNRAYGNHFVIGYAHNDLNITLNNQEFSSKTKALSDNRWHMLAVFRTGNHLEAYIDGNRVIRQQLPKHNHLREPLAPEVVRVGQAPNESLSNNLAGVIDDLWITERGLNQQELRSFANQQGYLQTPPVAGNNGIINVDYLSNNRVRINWTPAESTSYVNSRITYEVYSANNREDLNSLNSTLENGQRLNTNTLGPNRNHFIIDSSSARWVSVVAHSTSNGSTAYHPVFIDVSMLEEYRFINGNANRRGNHASFTGGSFGVDAEGTPYFDATTGGQFNLPVSLLHGEENFTIEVSIATLSNSASQQLLHVKDVDELTTWSIGQNISEEETIDGCEVIDTNTGMRPDTHPNIVTDMDTCNTMRDDVAFNSNLDFQTLSSLSSTTSWIFNDGFEEFSVDAPMVTPEVSYTSQNMETALEWHKVVITKSGNSCTFQLDGQDFSCGSFTNSKLDSSGSFVMGSEEGGSGFFMSNLRIYKN